MNLTLPNIVAATSGNLGQGFAAVIINGLKFCYQGTAPDPNTVAVTARYTCTYPASAISTPCSVTGCNDIGALFQIIAVSSGTMMGFTIEGGGCGTSCVPTVATAVVSCLAPTPSLASHKFVRLKN